MILHDHWCKFCGTSFEELVNWDQREIPCPSCGKTAERYFKSGCANTMPIDAGWLKSLVEVIDKDSNKPHCIEFLKNQTRDNYHNWMKGEGIRHLEPGEKPSKPEPFNMDRHTEKVAELRQQRNRLEVM